jgi:hypothetical protein
MLWLSALSALGGSGGGNSGSAQSQTIAPNVPITNTFGSVNFKSTGSGNAYPSAVNGGFNPLAADPITGAAPMPIWIWAAGAAAALGVLFLISRKK